MFPQPEVADAQVRLVEKGDEAALRGVIAAGPSVRAAEKCVCARATGTSRSPPNDQGEFSYGWVTQSGDNVNDLTSTFRCHQGGVDL